MGTMLRFRHAIADVGSRARSMVSREHAPSPQSAEQRVLRAVRFGDDESFARALAVLDELGREEPLEYELAVDRIAVLPQWSYERLIPRLDGEPIKYSDVKVASFRELSPESQAEARGLTLTQE